MAVVDRRALIVVDGLWCVENTLAIHYSEGANRNSWVGQPRRHLPIWCDCGTFYNMLFEWNGVPRPDGLPALSKIVGNTEILLARGQHMAAPVDLRPGDAIVYGYADDLSTQHVAMVYQTGTDPLMISHGMEAGPLEVRSHSEHPGQPRAYLRFSTLVTVPDPPQPPSPKPTPNPKPVPHPEDAVTTHDVSVKIGASGEGTTTVNVPFAKALAATSLAGAGANDCGHPSLASSGTSTVVTVRGAKANTTQDVRVTVAD